MVNFKLSIILLMMGILLSQTQCFAELGPDTSLITAVYLNDEKAVRKHLLNPETKKNELNPDCRRLNEICKPISVAAKRSSIEIMGLLLESGADINASSGFTGDTPLIIAIIENRFEMAKFLVEKGADVNKRNRFGITPLWGASADGKLEIVKLLLENGARIDLSCSAPDPIGKTKDIINNITPLMISASTNQKEIFRMLLKNGANINLKDSLNRSVFDYSETLGEEQTWIRP